MKFSKQAEIATESGGAGHCLPMLSISIFTLNIDVNERIDVSDTSERTCVDVYG